MKRLVVGKIVKDGKVMGTGFLISSDIVMTVKHNVITADELLTEPDEVKVVFCIDDSDKISGQTFNLREAINKRVDCVFIRLNEVISEDEMCDLVDWENEIVGVKCRIIGYPKLAQGKKILSANIIQEHEEELIVSVKREDQLPNYEGLSGAPVVISENIVGVIIKQENSERLEALSIRHIYKVLQCEGILIHEKEIPISISEEKFNFRNLKQKVEQVIFMVGPRYTKALNIKTGTYNNLNFILKKNGVAEQLHNISSQIKDCIRKLREFDSHNKGEEELVLKDNKMKIDYIIDLLERDNVILDSGSYENNELIQIFKHLEDCEQNLINVFEVEKKRFEGKNGDGTYNNKSWRGFMASYMCAFPAQYLDELSAVIKTLSLVKRVFDISLINSARAHAILITGKGGVGKTHLLCDIVDGFLEKNIPAVLLLGDMFCGENTADTVIMNWFQKGDTIDHFFAWLNEYGSQNNIYVPACIDAINEMNDISYWNINLPLLIAKAEEFPNIKIIVSCRSIYLEEYLEEEKISGMLQLSHNGFDEVELEALGNFCEYYGVNINYDTICTPGFMNLLFLKMLCEIAREKKDKTVVVEDIQTLMEEFFDMKNKTISKHYCESFSVKDKVVPLALSAVAQHMVDKDQYSISWSNLKTIIADILEKFGLKEKTSGFIKRLISENLLRESDGRETEITFAYQKFYEYLYAQKYMDKEIEIIVKAVEEKKITLGTLEMIQIAYLRNTKEEFLSKIDDRIHGEAVVSFMSGLYWRNENEISLKTITEIEKLLSSQNESDIRRVIFGLLAISTKTKCAVNAQYIHKKLNNMNAYRRDYILSFFFLKQYDQVEIISSMCERAIALNNNAVADDSILLWKIVLCWATGSNDIKLRDKASKGLVNLFRLYPLDMLTIIDMFKEVDDDYINERIWQAVYSALILIAKQKYAMPILKYIQNNIILVDTWPQNVLLRDYLRNIFEYAYYKGWCTEKEVIRARPPYKSKKHNVNKEFALQFKDRFSRLYWNCQESDFAIYTIPSEVEDYGITKKDVGLMIFEDIIKSGYESCKTYDRYIDYTYGSLRSRDGQVERIGKKYQKIYLYREMGNIYDNYKYSPRYQYHDVEILNSEQGNSFRNIDLTVIPQINRFEGRKLVYPFYRYSKWDDAKWFKNDDVERYISNLIEYTYDGEEYCMLQGYLLSKETGKESYREVWMQVRTYLYRKDKKDDLLNWFDGKNFEGRWMPEGFGQLYECCIGEYPWSPTMANCLVEKQDFRQVPSAPCYLITTVNDYLTEKDSPFSTNEGSSYMFPSKYLFEKMNLVWNGSFGYDVDGRTVISNGQNNTIYIDKNFLSNFLRQNNLDIVWTVLGEKQKIPDGFDRVFPGRGEFSYTYYLNNICEISCNHKKYSVIEPREYS